MCIAFILWQIHPCYRFFLALNRDELHDRPTLPVHWWPEDEILAGKDLSQGGTWFGCTKAGRVAVVTSFREVDSISNAVSRGALIPSFLKNTKTPLEYAKEVSEDGQKYNGFNLILADLNNGDIAYVSNRPKDNPIHPETIAPGLHVLCNASLNVPWPKVVRGHTKMDQLIEELGSSEIPKRRIVEELLMDNVKADVSALPNTGCSLELEIQLSSIFVDTFNRQGPYGTRSMLVFSVDKAGKAELYEQYLEEGNWKEHEFQFSISQGNCENVS